MVANAGQEELVDVEFEHVLGNLENSVAELESARGQDLVERLVTTHRLVTDLMNQLPTINDAYGSSYQKSSFEKLQDLCQRTNIAASKIVAEARGMGE